MMKDILISMNMSMNMATSIIMNSIPLSGNGLSWPL